MSSVENIQAKIKLDVAVIGGGICGLSIAIACARTGMNVTVYEAVSIMNEVGAGIQIGSNVTRILRSWNLLDELLPHGTVLEKNSLRSYNDIELARIILNNNETNLGAPNFAIHRADLHSVLKMGAEKAGAKICKGLAVEDIDCENTRIKIKNNPNWIQADVILAADGIRSLARKKMLEFRSEVDNVRETGDAAWRVVVPAERIYASKDARLVDILENLSVMRWIGPGGHIVCYPIRNHSLLNIVLVHPDKKGTQESWTTKGDKKEMVAFYTGWNTRVQELINCVPETEVLEWKLCDHLPLTTWVEGRVALSGDAAHPMLPYFAQGASQAIEDAATIGICLAMIDSKTQVNAALKVYELVRKERAEIIQASAEQNKLILHLDNGKEQEDRDEMIRNVAKGVPNPYLLTDKSFQKWILSMDAQQQTLDKWEQLLKLVTSGTSFESPFTTKGETWIHKIRRSETSYQITKTE